MLTSGMEAKSLRLPFHYGIVEKRQNRVEQRESEKDLHKYTVCIILKWLKLYVKKVVLVGEGKGRGRGR